MNGPEPPQGKRHDEKEHRGFELIADVVVDQQDVLGPTIWVNSGSLAVNGAFLDRTELNSAKMEIDHQGEKDLTEHGPQNQVRLHRPRVALRAHEKRAWWGSKRTDAEMLAPTATSTTRSGLIRLSTRAEPIEFTGRPARHGPDKNGRRGHQGARSTLSMRTVGEPLEFRAVLSEVN